MKKLLMPRKQTWIVFIALLAVSLSWLILWPYLPNYLWMPLAMLTTLAALWLVMVAPVFGITALKPTIGDVFPTITSGLTATGWVFAIIGSLVSLTLLYILSSFVASSLKRPQKNSAS